VSETGQGFGILGVIEGVQLESVLNSHDRGPATVPDGVRHPCQTGRLRQLSAIVGERSGGDRHRIHAEPAGPTLTARPPQPAACTRAPWLRCAQRLVPSGPQRT
jgi:hypothetical protein